MRGEIIILTGPPGAGKSTIARRLAAGIPRAVHLRTDDFWHYVVAPRIPPFLPEADPQNQVVMDVIAAAAQAFAGGGYTTVVDGIVGPWMLHHFVPSVTTDTTIRYVVLRPSREETLARAQARTAMDALVDEAPILALYEQFSDLGALDDHVIDSSGQTPDATLAAVQGATAEDRFLLQPDSSSTPEVPRRLSRGSGS